jgi:NTE family protein
MTTTHFSSWRSRLHPRQVDNRQVGTSAAPTRPDTTVFVFSGGGLNGAAQVGMLEELYAWGILPDAVVGVSAGAINALNLAVDPVEWNARLRKSWLSAASMGVFKKSQAHAIWAIIRSRPSVDSGYAFAQVLKSNMPVDDIAQCVLPVRIGTVALTTGEMQWWSRGSAYQTLLASCAIPGVFPPVTLGGTLHVDGGVCSPVPVAAAIEFNPTRIVILDVSLVSSHAPTKIPPEPTALNVLLRSFEAARRRVTAAELAAITPDIEVIHIRAGSLASMENAPVTAIPRLIDEGRAAARAVLDAREIKNAHALKSAPVPTTALPRRQKSLQSVSA